MYSKIKTSRVFNRAAAPFSGLMTSSAWAQAPVIVSLPPLKVLLLLGALALVPFAAVDYLLRQHVVSLVMSLDLWGYLREVGGGPRLSWQRCVPVPVLAHLPCAHWAPRAWARQQPECRHAMRAGWLCVGIGLRCAWPEVPQFQRAPHGRMFGILRLGMAGTHARSYPRAVAYMAHRSHACTV